MDLGDVEKIFKALKPKLNTIGESINKPNRPKKCLTTLA